MLPGVSLAQQSSDRIALVIGNAKYPDARTPLPTTIKDATQIADEFRRLNFDVEFKTNLTKEDMQRAVDDFVGKVKQSTTAMFYFTGYGIQVSRRSYLIPTNAQIWTEADVRRDGIGVDAILSDVHRKGARVKIVIIDAARRNPYERRFRPAAGGLAPVEAPTGTLALFSAAPGKLIDESKGGSTSMFGTELLKELQTPDLSVEEMFNRTRIDVSRASQGEQVPWVASSLLEEFSFSKSSGGTRSSNRTQPTTSSPFPPAPDYSPQPPPSSNPPPEPRRATLSPPREPVSGAFKSGDVFRDCADCPEVVVVPAGSFEMGSSNNDREKPVHQINISAPFAIGVREVTFEEWDMCVTENGCKFRPADRGWGRGNRPVINVSWLDAKEFVSWLSQKTGAELPAAFGGRVGICRARWHRYCVLVGGRSVGTKQANCRECRAGEREQTLPAGTFKPNAVRSFRHRGKRRGMGRRLLERRLPRRSD